MAGSFDNEAFFAALNAERLSRRLNWKEVANQAGIQPSTISRMSQGKNPDVNSLAALMAWSNLRTDSFLKSEMAEDPAPISRVTALLRADPSLSRESVDILEKIIHTTYEALRDR